ncbi:MAG TPA: PDZ domain-containing protein [Bacteroidales bacterium]|nr:PDZ domain-containing protein [Bacteroidales bacterium]
MKFKIVFSLLICFCFVTAINAQNEMRLLRFPAISGNKIVFSYAGDLYMVDKKGGIARKLTNDIGYEMFAKFSPDGKNIGFTAQYDGNTEIYIMPASGGVPKRLTYTATLNRDDLSDRMGPNNILMAWKDDQTLIYRSRMKSFNDFKGQLYQVAADGGLSEELPLPSGGFCSFSPDKSKLAYNKVFREFRTWKYYKGGMADDIWIYDFKEKTTLNITNNIAQDIFPMWHGDNIYFLSDRDRIMNLFCYDLATKEIKKLTDFTEFDIKFPSLGDSAIVFENGGYIYTYDFKTQKSVKVTIQIADDLNTGRNEMKDASKNITSYDISPDGKRLVFSGRGDVYTVPAKSGITRNLTQSSGVHDRNATWSPDGKYIAYISDATGEDEIYMIAQDGTSAPVKLTEKSDTYKYQPVWSPDSKKLLWADKMLRLQYIDVYSKKVTQIDKSNDGEFTEFGWAPDSKWIAYARPDKSAETKIYLYDVASMKKYPVTDGWYDCGEPTFSSDGKYLYFTSSRDFNPTYSWTEWNHAYTNMTKVYMLTLAKTTPSPFKPVDDEVGIATGSKEPENKEAGNKTGDITVDIDGIVDRIIALPIGAGSYWNINSADDLIYYCRTTASEPNAALMVYDLKEKRETNLGAYSSYILSNDKKKMVVADKGKYAVVDLPKSKVDIKDYTDLSNMKVWVNLKDEWKQIFTESWRQMRDFFYDPGMHGVDWKSIYKKYEPLTAYVNHRADLTYIIGEMIGELSVGHAYTGGGEKPEAAKIKLGLLGATLTKDKSGYFKIEKILHGENWTNNTRSPLTEVGVDVREGDFIVAVNGKSVTGIKNIYELLVNTAGQQVELTVNTTASEQGAHKVIVIPVDDESELYYYNWVQNNIKKVNEATDGKVGYIHIPDMSVTGLNEFVKHFYPQLSKNALIIDDRGNGGGNVSPMIIERLNRELVYMKMSRNASQNIAGIGQQYGPKICLIDQYSASDGDLFPYQFKELKIGKLVGQRTWGGVVGIRGSLPLIDGGFLNKPEFAHYDAEGKKWIIEGHGVDPDVLIINDPAKEYAGDDEQLNKAIELILEELKKTDTNLPPIPPFPDKTK